MDLRDTNPSAYLQSNTDDWMNMGPDERRAHLREHKQHRETMQNFEDQRTFHTGTLQRQEEAEGNKKMEPDSEVREALLCIDRSREEDRFAEELGYCAPWERLHPDTPGPLLSLGTRFWALIIGNDNYPSVSGVPALGGCVNDAHLVKDYLKNYLQVPEDHIVLLENACRNEMINALYNLRDNEAISSGDNILIHYSGYGSLYDFGSIKLEAICPIDRGSNADISERELDTILLELSAKKGQKITFISDCCGSGSCIRHGRSGTCAFRVAPPLQDEMLNHMLQQGNAHPRRHSHVNLFSEKWERDLASFVELSAGFSTTEVDIDFGNSKGKHGLFTFALIKFLESKEGRGATYEGVIQLINRLRYPQIPRAIGARKTDLLWFREVGQEASSVFRLPAYVT